MSATLSPKSTGSRASPLTARSRQGVGGAAPHEKSVTNPTQGTGQGISRRPSSPIARDKASTGPLPVSRKDSRVTVDEGSPLRRTGSSRGISRKGSSRTAAASAPPGFGAGDETPVHTPGQGSHSEERRRYRSKRLSGTFGKQHSLRAGSTREKPKRGRSFVTQKSKGRLGRRCGIRTDWAGNHEERLALARREALSFLADRGFMMEPAATGEEEDLQTELDCAFRRLSEPSPDEKAALADWTLSETRLPTDPYSVLRARPEDPPTRIASLIRRRLRQLGEATTGAANVLRQRVERAHGLLSDEDQRIKLDEQRENARAAGKWARVVYPDGRGLYEGGVAQKDGIFAGEIVAMRHGKGIMVVESGERYEGEYVHDRREGVGLQLWSNGDVYVGEWLADRLHGLGVYYSGDGDCYAGQFESGRRHGEGRHQWPGGNTYHGEFRQNERSGGGLAQVVGSNGEWRERYIGGWKDGLRHGRGLVATRDGGRYVGQFDHGVWHGLGIALFPNGDLFKGFFEDGRMHGAGTYSWGNDGPGALFSGDMHGGKPLGRGRIDFTDQTFATLEEGARPRGTVKSLEVPFFDGKPHGQGVLEGECPYKGQWRGGLKDGQGECSWPCGTRYQGEFRAGRRHGKGRVEWPNGSSFEGRFEQDTRHGDGIFTEMLYTVGGSKPRADVPHGDQKNVTSYSTSFHETWYHGSLASRNSAACRAVDPEVDDLEYLEEEFLGESLHQQPSDSFKSNRASEATESGTPMRRQTNG